jgi:hypothetical protein
MPTNHRHQMAYKHRASSLLKSNLVNHSLYLSLKSRNVSNKKKLAGVNQEAIGGESRV